MPKSVASAIFGAADSAGEYPDAQAVSGVRNAWLALSGTIGRQWPVGPEANQCLVGSWERDHQPYRSSPSERDEEMGAYVKITWRLTYALALCSIVAHLSVPVVYW